jgi:tripartite-type tricarboxylate transporter receptor subunit TctC
VARHSLDLLAEWRPNASGANGSIEPPSVVEQSIGGMAMRFKSSTSINVAVASCCAVTIASLSGGIAFAQADYPNQPVRMLVGNTAGSASDNLGRILAGRLSQTLGKQFLVVNQTGAGGTIAAEAVARSAPDGYTLYITSTQAHAISPHLYPNAKYRPLEDFAAVTMLAKTESLLVVPAASPFKSVAELVANAKSNPGKIMIANAGPGSQSHLSGAMFTHLAKINMLEVPYKGAASVTAVVGAQNDLTIVPMPSVMGLVNAGKLRALAMGGRARTPLLPDVPTLEESGVKGYASTGWTGIVAPKGTPGAVIAKLRSSIIEAVADPAIADALLKAGGEPWTMTPAEMEKFIAEELARFGEIIKITGAKVQ